MRVPSQRSHEQLLYNSTAGREERSGLRCTSSHSARVHRSAPRMRPRIRATRASSPTSEMPRIGGRYFNKRKVWVTWQHVPWVRTCHVSEPATSFFFQETLLSDRRRLSDSRGALQSSNVRIGLPVILLNGGVTALLRPPARQPVLLARSEYTCAFMPAVQCSLFAPAQSLAGSL
jgi:hypothetical protein